MSVLLEYRIVGPCGFSSVEIKEGDFKDDRPSASTIFALAESLARRYYSQSEITKVYQKLLKTSEYVESRQKRESC